MLTADWIIYPNPTSGTFTVRINAENGEGTLEVIDMLGKSILEIPAKSIQEISTAGECEGFAYRGK
ncbi:MAG: T9SS type A sorting domain-containing protein [Fluviicola sp.]